MATEIHSKNSFPGYYSMRNANEDSNSSWHLFNTLTSSHYYDGFTPRTATDAYLGQDKDELKQKMLQHEAVFKNQVYFTLFHNQTLITNSTLKTTRDLEMAIENIVEVTSLSPRATENDVREFFAFCGTIEHIDIIRAGEYACTAYVTFKDAYSLETAVLLSGATLLDQTICITRWGQDSVETEYWNGASSWIPEDGNTSYTSYQSDQYGYTAGEAVTVAQDVVKTMLAKGYILGKDALGKAKAFDESHQMSSSAAAKMAELSERSGLTDKLFAGVEAVRYADQTYHISDTTKSVVFATGRTAAAAATTVVNSSYFSQGALWMSGALTRAAKAAANLGNNGVGK